MADVYSRDSDECGKDGGGHDEGASERNRVVCGVMGAGDGGVRRGTYNDDPVDVWEAVAEEAEAVWRAGQ